MNRVVGIYGGSGRRGAGVEATVVALVDRGVRRRCWKRRGSEDKPRKTQLYLELVIKRYRMTHGFTPVDKIIHCPRCLKNGEVGLLGEGVFSSI